MRILITKNHPFDTRLDTKKLFVPMKHRFYPHNYVNKQGKSLVYIKLYEPNKTPIKDAIDVYVNPKFWSEAEQRVTVDHPNFADINLTIDNIESNITGIKTYFRLSQKYMSLETFYEEFKKGTDRIDFCQYLKNQIEHQYNIGRIKINTRKKERSVCKMLMEWREKILFHELTLEVLQKFVSYRKKTVSKTTMNSNLKIIKKYLIDASYNGIKMPLEIRKIKIGSTDGKKESLTDAELKKLKAYFESDFLKDSHIIPVANFLMSCCTGLRLSDVQMLSKSSFKDDMIIVESTVKTEKYQKIKLNNYAHKILQTHPEILTNKLSDQYINRSLKDICLLLGIHKNVTFHHGRHTFATQILRKGGKVEILQKMLNHSNIKETMTYVTILQEEQDQQIMLLDD